MTVHGVHFLLNDRLVCLKTVHFGPDQNQTSADSTVLVSFMSGLSRKSRPLPVWCPDFLSNVCPSGFCLCRFYPVSGFCPEFREKSCPDFYCPCPPTCGPRPNEPIESLPECVGGKDKKNCWNHRREDEFFKGCIKLWMIIFDINHESDKSCQGKQKHEHTISNRLKFICESGLFWRILKFYI